MNCFTQVTVQWFSRVLLVIALLTGLGQTEAPSLAELRGVASLPKSERHEYLRRKGSELTPDLLTKLLGELDSLKGKTDLKSRFLYFDLGDFLLECAVQQDLAWLAELCLTRNVAVNTTSHSLLEHAREYLERGDLANAERMFHSLAACLYRPNTCHYYLACICLKTGREEEAWTHLRQAHKYDLQLSPLVQKGRLLEEPSHYYPGPSLLLSDPPEELPEELP